MVKNMRAKLAPAGRLRLAGSLATYQIVGRVVTNILDSFYKYSIKEKI